LRSANLITPLSKSPKRLRVSKVVVALSVQENGK